MKTELKYDYVPKRGDIVMATVKGIGGAIQMGTRPYIVLTNNLGNLHGPTIIAAPLSTRIKRMDLPVHVLLTNSDLKEGELIDSSIILLEQMIVIDKKNLIRKIAQVKEEIIENFINPGIKVSLDID